MSGFETQLKRTGIPLGVWADTEYTVSEDFPLEPGDLLALMTDGVEESASEDGEMFGRRLADAEQPSGGECGRNRGRPA